MRQSLGVIAEIISGGRADTRTLAWEKLRYQHCQAVRTALAEKYAAGTTNKMLAALRGVLKEAWRLGLTSAENYHRAVDLKAIKSETLPRGRALSSGELGSGASALRGLQTYLPRRSVNGLPSKRENLFLPPAGEVGEFRRIRDGRGEFSKKPLDLIGLEEAGTHLIGRDRPRPRRVSHEELKL